MEERNIYNGFISGNVLKIIACITMFIDHVGWILLPGLTVLRAIGRLSMPLFAFTFGEGCHYTRSRGRHFALVFCMGLVTSAAMSYVMGYVYGNILITFSLSMLIIYPLDGLKKYALSRRAKGIALCSVLLALALALAVGVCCFAPVEIDYGLAGVTLPVCVRLLDVRSFSAAKGKAAAKGGGAQSGAQSGEHTQVGEHAQDGEHTQTPANVGMARQGGTVADMIYQPVTVLLLFFINLLVLSAVYGVLQFISILSMLPLMAYSGKRGKYKLKGLFYAFYPAHLAIIAAIYLIIDPAYLSTLF